MGGWIDGCWMDRWMDGGWIGRWIVDGRMDGMRVSFFVVGFCFIYEKPSSLAHLFTPSAHQKVENTALL